MIDRHEIGYAQKTFLLTFFMFYAPLGNFRICEYIPLHPLPYDVTFGKMSGDLEKFPARDLGGNFRIREYTPPPPDDVTFVNYLI